MASPPTDASITIRLWMEPHDGEVRARVTSTLRDSSRAARGTDDVLAAVRALLEEFRGAVDLA